MGTQFYFQTNLFTSVQPKSQDSWRNAQVEKPFHKCDVGDFCPQNTRCGCKVPGIILLQASYLNTYSLLRGVTFTVLTFSSYVLSRMMMPLPETFCELLLRNSFQCCRHIFLFRCLQYSPPSSAEVKE